MRTRQVVAPTGRCYVLPMSWKLRASYRFDGSSWLGVAFAVGFAATCAHADEKSTSDDPPLDIRADHLELDQQAGVARFDGDVEVTQDRFRLRCNQLVVRYADDGAVTQLVASGAVQLRAHPFSARAGRAEIDVRQRSIVLTGEPEIRRHNNRAGNRQVAHLRGDRIKLWPDEGRLTIDQVRGTFEFRPMGRAINGSTPPKTSEETHAVAAQ